MIFEHPTPPPNAAQLDWVVARSFRAGTRPLPRGTTLAGQELTAMRNWKALIASRFVELAPRPQVTRYPINKGFRRWDVLEGRRINREPLSKEQAELLAQTTGAEND